MTDPQSPWAPPGSGEPRVEVIVPPILATSQPITASPLTPPLDTSWRAGAVTGTSLVLEAPLAPPEAPQIDEAARARRTVKWFAAGAGAVLTAGLVVLLVMISSGRGPFHATAAAPPDTRPPLAKACPPPPAMPSAPSMAPSTPHGDRTVDTRSGISYKAFGAPWRTWTDNWSNAGELKVSYRTGQYFVTEQYPGGDYLASILSGSVPATNNDALTLDLRCTGHQVAADVRSAYYPNPNTMDMIKDKAVVLGGRPAWLSEFRLHFHAYGLKATDEFVAIALIDVGRPEAAILYVSIPGTHRQYDHVVDEVLASVRPITR